MQTRIQEIHDRASQFNSMAFARLTSTLIFADIPYMLNKIKELQTELDKKTRMLDLANGALKRAGSAAQFGIKRDIPEGVLVFKDTAESLENISDVYCDCELLQQSKHRERVLRQALERIYNATAPDRGLTMHETTQIYVRAREALKQEGQA